MKDGKKNSVPEIPTTYSNSDSEDQKAERSTNNPFDPKALRLSQSYGQVGVNKIRNVADVKKPPKQEYIRTRKGEEWQLETNLVYDEHDNEVYLVAPSIWPLIPGEIKATVLFCAITLGGDFFLWPVKLPIEGQTDRWSRPVLDAASRAEDSWIRITWNQHLRHHEIFEATGDHPEPSWPDLTFEEVLRIAFGDRFIQDLSHPVLRRLRGEI